MLQTLYRSVHCDGIERDDTTSLRDTEHGRLAVAILCYMRRLHAQPDPVFARSAYHAVGGYRGSDKSSFVM